MAGKRIREAVGGGLVVAYVSGPIALRRGLSSLRRVVPDLVAFMIVVIMATLAMVGVFALVFWASTGEWPVIPEQAP